MIETIIGIAVLFLAFGILGCVIYGFFFDKSDPGWP